MKKALSLILAVVMILSLTTVTAFADTPVLGDKVIVANKSELPAAPDGTEWELIETTYSCGQEEHTHGDSCYMRTSLDSVTLYTKDKKGNYVEVKNKDNIRPSTTQYYIEIGGEYVPVRFRFMDDAVYYPACQKATHRHSSECARTYTYELRQIPINYGSNYNHIQVKTDAEYNYSIDGTAGKLTGTVLYSSITVKIGGKSYTGFSSSTIQEGSHYEYNKSISRVSPEDLGLTWVSGTYQPSNVTVSAKIIFKASTVPEELKPYLTLEKDGSYSVTVTDYKYTGVNECTGGNGMRSEGNSGTPSGLDLYLNTSGLDVITKGKLGISKKVVDENGTALTSDTSEFEYTITSGGNPVYFVNNVYTADSSVTGATNIIKVQNGQTVSLTGLPAGTYTVTERQKAGYIIRDIDGQASTTNYSKDYVITVKDDTNIPVANFTNTRLSDKAGVDISKTASGLPAGTVYPDPTVSIYAADAEGKKTGNALFTGTLDANGDTLYLTTLFAPGKYVVEETGAEVEGYDLAASVSKNSGTASDDMTFTVEQNDKGQRVSLTLNNAYTKTPDIQKGALVIVKDLAGDISLDENGKFVDENGNELDNPPSLTFTLYNSDGRPVKTVDTLTFVPAADGKPAYLTATVNDLVAGTYTVIENGAKVFNYDCDTAYSPARGAVTIADKQTTTLTVTNTYTRQEQVELTIGISKQIDISESYYAPEGSRTFYFDIEADSDDPDLDYIPGEFSFTGDFQKSDDASKGDFMVSVTGASSASGSVVIKATLDELAVLINSAAFFSITENTTGISDGWSYDTAEFTISDIDYDDDGNLVYSLKKDGQLIANSSSISFRNSYSNTDTGSITVVKKLSGNDVDASDEFEFRLDLTYGPNDGYFPLTFIKYNVSGDTIDQGAFSSSSSVTFTLKGDETIDITGIPYGIPYTVTETNSKDYTPSYTKNTGTLSANSSAAKVTVTNTRNKTAAKTISVSVTKVWDDNNNKNNSRPDSVSVWLVRNGVPYSKVELSAANRWTYTWNDLDAGQHWSIQEASAHAGYLASVKTYNGRDFILTNTLYTKENIHTGDSTHLIAAGALLVLAGAATAVILGKKRRNSK